MAETVFDLSYDVIRSLGEGGMGEVFLAEHRKLGRLVAIKVLQPQLAASPDFAARFRREARATARVRHPNIVAILDFGRLPDGRLFMALEYVDGQALDERLAARGPFGVAPALRLLDQLCDAAGCAHALGVIHRDLKPSNLVLVDEGEARDVLKVLDFGMAKIVAQDVPESFRSHDGDIMGTPAYMAPEQLGGAPTDPRMDLYAIGCVAHELLVGAPAFAGSLLQILQNKARWTPPLPSTLRPEADIPPELDRVVARCLAVDPAARFASAAELRQALATVAGATPGPRGAQAVDRREG